MLEGFGERLEYYMSLRGFSQKDLAIETGLTEAAISRYVSNAREPKAIAIVKIAQALKVSTDDLLGIESQGEDDFDGALRLVARNAESMTPDQKKALIGALIN